MEMANLEGRRGWVRGRDERWRMVLAGLARYDTTFLTGCQRRLQSADWARPGGRSWAWAHAVARLFTDMCLLLLLLLLLLLSTQLTCASSSSFSFSFFS